MKKSLLIGLFAICGIANAQTWAPFGANNLSIAVRTMIIDTATNTLYVGGTGGVAKWNGSSWTYLGALTTGSVASLAIYNGTLYAGGNLPSNSHIVQWSGTAWNTVTTGTNGAVNVLCVYNNKLVVAGSFSTSGGVLTYGFANWDGTTWTNFGAGYPYNPSGTSVLTMQVINGKLFVAGGDLSLITTSYPHAAIASYTGSAWADETAGAGLGMQSVYSLALHNGTLYAGGTFKTTATRVAKQTAGAWSTVGSGTDSTVFSLLSYKNNLYAGGAFTVAGGNQARYIAKWDTVSWTEPDSGMGVVGNQPFVLSLIMHDSCLVAGGQFTKAGGNSAANIAKLCSSVTGIASTFEQYQIKSFPNPFSTQTVLHTDNLLHNATLTVDNCFGQTVAQIKNINGRTVVFSRDNLASGLYFVRLMQENKIYATEKLIITDK
ncbi:MAG: T9SS type A sorting domain-containing protein [Bacteroidetes bacterium]|nr:T9SS type A sorting domain-containing protein [Bacteroidota bacterium]